MEARTMYNLIEENKTSPLSREIGVFLGELRSLKCYRRDKISEEEFHRIYPVVNEILKHYP